MHWPGRMLAKAAPTMKSDHLPHRDVMNRVIGEVPSVCLESKNEVCAYALLKDIVGMDRLHRELPHSAP